MSSRNLPQRISDFLVRHQPRQYCDACIQERLGLRWRQQVQLVTATLAATDLFERKLYRCSNCEETKQVTVSVKRPSASSTAPTPRQKLRATLSKKERKHKSIDPQRNVQAREYGNDDHTVSEKK